MKNYRLVGLGMKVLVVVALLGLISSGCGGPATKVTVETVGPRAIEETVMVAGSLQGTNPAQVIPQVFGTVQQVYATDGQYVAAGQPIVQLDTSNLEQSLLSAEASLESVQSLASLGNMFGGLSSTINNLSGSFTDVLKTVDSGFSNLVALERLLVPLLPEDQRMTALQTIESANQNVQQSISQLEGRPAPAASFGGGIGTGAQQAAAAKSIQNAEKNLKGATIVAPIAGTLVSASSGGSSIQSMLSSLMSGVSGMVPSGLNLSALTGVSSGLGGIGIPTSGPLSPGAFVTNGTPIFSIVDLKNMSMVAQVDETDIAKIQPGQSAQVSLEAYPGQSFEGQVVKVSDTSTTNQAGATAFDVTVQMKPADINLKIGMTASGNIVVAKKNAATVVPVEALIEKKGQKYVFKVVDGKARLTPVEVGLTSDVAVEITQGVKNGDLVVTQGVEQLKDGQGVKQ